MTLAVTTGFTMAARSKKRNICQLELYTLVTTGTLPDRKEGRFNLGHLECDGDMLFDNMVTFRLSDGVVELPIFEMGLTSGNIFFEFRTSLVEDPAHVDA